MAKKKPQNTKKAALAEREAKSVVAAPAPAPAAKSASKKAAAAAVSFVTPVVKSDAPPHVAMAKPAAAAAHATPASADVSARAHQIWIAKGKPTPGSPLADWLQAERELGVRKS